MDNTIRYSNPGIRDLQHAAAIFYTDLITYDALYYKATDANAYFDAYGDIVGGIGSYPVLGNPYYHQVTDRRNAVNQQLVAEVSKTTVATLMMLASGPARLRDLAARRMGGAEVEGTCAAARERGVGAYLVRWTGDRSGALREELVAASPENRIRVGIPVSDIAAGMHAYGAILEAPLQRERTGRGHGIRVSLFDATADRMSVPYLYHLYRGSAPPRSGLMHPAIAPYGTFRASDGGHIQMAIQNEREWERLCQGVLRRPELADDSRFRSNAARVVNRGELQAAIQEVFDAVPVTELIERLSARWSRSDR